MPLARRVLPLAAAILVAGGGCLAADGGAKGLVTAPSRLIADKGRHDFYSRFLQPRMSAELADERGAVEASLAARTADPWMRDPGLSRRLEGDALSAAKGAVKRYVLERLDVDAWSLPLLHDSSRMDATGAPARGARVRFGVAHLTPRAEVVVPVAAGRFAFSADARGRMGVSFETGASGVRLGGSFDPVAHEAGFGLTARF